MSATARKLHDPQLQDPQLQDDAQHDELQGAALPRERMRAQLRLVSPLRPERASRGVFALIVAGLLGLGLIAMLLINTQLAQGAFVVSDLTRERAQLLEQEAVLNEEVAAAAAPSTLSSRARALGMVPSETPVFLRVPDGQVLGTPRATKVPPGANAPRIALPADATATEAVANASVGTDIPVALPPDYDPAAADAGLDAVPLDQLPPVPVDGAPGKKAGEKAGGKAGEKAGEKNAKADGTKAKGEKKAKGGAAANSPWVEVPVDTGDAGLDAVPLG